MPTRSTSMSDPGHTPGGQHPSAEPRLTMGIAARLTGVCSVTTSDPLEEDLEITGHPIVRLLREFDARRRRLHRLPREFGSGRNGPVYLTEGILRAIHRRDFGRSATLRNVWPLSLVSAQGRHAAHSGRNRRACVQAVSDIGPGSRRTRNTHRHSGPRQGHLRTCTVDRAAGHPCVSKRALSLANRSSHRSMRVAPGSCGNWRITFEEENGNIDRNQGLALVGESRHQATRSC